jgi:O-antigen/teichoic acid export membrane protein
MKTSKARSSFYNLIFDYINTFLGIVYGVLLVPLYLHYFDITTYGAWLASGSVIAIMGIFDMGMNLVFAQKLASAIGAKKWDEFSKEYTAGMVISVILFVLMCLAGLLIAHYIPHLVNARVSDYSIISNSFIIATIGAGLTIISQNMAAALSALLETKALGIISTVSLIAGVGVTIYTLIIGLGVIAIPFGVLVRNIINTIGTALLVRSVWRKYDIKYRSLEKKYLMDLLKSVAPVFTSRTATMLLRNNQLIIIANVLGPGPSAIYSLTSKAISTVGGFIMPIASAVFASFSQLHGEMDKKKILNATNMLMQLITVVSCIAVLGSVFLNKNFVYLWVGKKAFGGNLLTIFIAISFIFNVRSNTLNTLLMALGKMISSSVAEFITALAQFLIIILCISKYGIIAIPIAEIISVILMRSIILVKIFKQYFECSWKDSIKLNLSGFEILIPLFLLSIFLQSVVPSVNWYVFGILAIGWCILVILFMLFFKSYRRLIEDTGKRFFKRKII